MKKILQNGNFADMYDCTAYHFDFYLITYKKMKPILKN